MGATQPPAPQPETPQPETALPPTEQRNPASTHLDTLSAADIVALMNAQEYRVLRAVEDAAALLAVAAERVAASFQAGGRTVLIGADTPGRLAVQEVAELPPTFGVPADRFIVLAAGSAAMGPSAITQDEDDTEAAPRALADLDVTMNDTVIGIAASGTTPFVRAGVKAATAIGAWTFGLANNPGSPLLAEAGLGILLDTGPEVLTGSTRLKAGTAQKLALNRITTAAMVPAGSSRITWSTCTAPAPSSAGGPSGSSVISPRLTSLAHRSCSRRPTGPSARLCAQAGPAQSTGRAQRAGPA